MKKKTQHRDIGIDAKPPKETCEDLKCPWHGQLPVRGKIIQGNVVSSRAQKTAVIEKTYFHYIQKFERYERRHSRISAYNPVCISAKEGDVVRIAECRPISKTKHFVVIEKV